MPGDGGAVVREVLDKSARFNLVRDVARVLAALDDQNLERRISRDQSQASKITVYWLLITHSLLLRLSC
jgi:hypothetical protein